MKLAEVRAKAFAMPLNDPAYPKRVSINSTTESLWSSPIAPTLTASLVVPRRHVPLSN